MDQSKSDDKEDNFVKDEDQEEASNNYDKQKNIVASPKISGRGGKTYLCPFKCARNQIVGSYLTQHLKRNHSDLLRSGRSVSSLVNEIRAFSLECAMDAADVDAE
jgi:hypothetical protein